MRKIVLLCILIAVVFCGCSSAADIGTEVVKNGGFESKGKYWSVYSSADGKVEYVEHDDSTKSADGDLQKYCVKITNGSFRTQTYVKQKIHVEPNSVYKLTCKVGVNDNSTIRTGGVFIYFLEDQEVKSDVFSWGNDLANNEYGYYFTTDLNKLTLIASFGTEDSLCKGSAYIDNISVVKVNPLDVEEKIITVEATPPKGNDPFSYGYMVIGCVLTLILVIVAVLLIAFDKKLKDTSRDGVVGFLIKHAGVITVCVIGLFVRLILARNIYGFDTDVGCFTYWGRHLATWSMGDIYTATNCDYTPLYLYFLWLCGAIASWTRAGRIGQMFIFKMPAVLFDIASSIVLYVFFNKRGKRTEGLIGAGLYALLPVVFTNSAVWGQVDSFLSLFLLLTLMCIYDDNITGVFVFYTLAVSAKIQAAFIFPAVAVYVIKKFVQNKPIRNKMILTFALCLVGFFAISIPFTYKSMQERPFILLERYAGTIGSYNYYDLNSFNFYGAIFKNGKVMPDYMNIINVVFIVGVCTLSVFALLKSKDRIDYAIISAFIICAMFSFSVKMHERYEFPAVLILIFAALTAKDEKLLLVTFGVSLLQFMNMAALLGNSGFLNTFMAGKLVWFGSNDVFFVIMSWLQVAFTLYFAYYVVRRLLIKPQKDVK